MGTVTSDVLQGYELAVYGMLQQTPDSAPEAYCTQILELPADEV